MDDMGRDRQEMTVLTARDAGLVGCTRCGRVWPEGTAECGRCGARLHPVDGRGLQRVWAWWLAGLIFYIPANLTPMLRTATLTGHQENTILGGVVELVAHGSYFVAAIVFLASIVIPISKFLAIAYLALSVGNERRAGAHPHLHLYEVVEFIGRWSMIDVFVVAILSALVQLGTVASIHPGPAAASFALSVALTMLSAQSFDPRLIWRGPARTTGP
ncbi:paraquat-inducible membrane protein A [Rhodobacter xanthinilyticus]|uniref:Paraquat-inducible membrane protein A n=1 Tax=Rhodobacter xanthinilyticus TaxID=1850250 RepID=A0A1D9M8X6_9RHOB|nr:paraquat-inducible protein A [Rhodobacter xanthinilyticus]AOZ68315.1 paraquat-inducible membrane protein A [Rhodobacter xanthinilyticus]